MPGWQRRPSSARRSGPQPTSSRCLPAPNSAPSSRRCSRTLASKRTTTSRRRCWTTCATPSRTPTARIGSSRRWKPCTPSIRTASRCATGPAPTTRTCPPSTAPGCTTRRRRTQTRRPTTASTSRSRRSGRASGTSAPSWSENTTGSTIRPPRWACWCTPTTPMSWPTAWRSAPTRSGFWTACTTSTPRSARTWSPTRSRTRCPRSCCSTPRASRSCCRARAWPSRGSCS